MASCQFFFSSVWRSTAWRFGYASLADGSMSPRPYAGSTVDPSVRCFSIQCKVLEDGAFWLCFTFACVLSGADVFCSLLFGRLSVHVSARRVHFSLPLLLHGLGPEAPGLVTYRCYAILSRRVSFRSSGLRIMFPLQVIPS